MVELADLAVDRDVVACPTTFGFDMANSVVSRLCANALGANDGSIITGRAPTASFNMDSVPLASMNIYDMLDKSTLLQLSGYLGTTPGNCVMFLGNGQLTAMPYAETDGLRKNDNAMSLCGIGGNDELLIYAC
jgi:hypothetical protein